MPQAAHSLPRGAYKALHIACLFVAAGAAAVGARAWLSPPPPPAPAAAVPALAGTRPESAGEGPESELVTILPGGIEPAEITRPRGTFLLVVGNRSGLEQVTWRLDRVAGGRLHEVRLAEGRLLSGQYEDLPPGVYLLTVAGYPEWACRITITPN